MGFIGGSTTDRKVPRRLRRMLIRGAVALAVGAAALAYLDLQGPVPMLQTALPYVAPVVVLLGVLALVARAWLAAGVAFACAVAILLPLWAPLGGAGGAAGSGRAIRIMSMNVEFGQADPHAIVDAVRRHRIDTLVLLEESEQHWQQLQDAGLGALLPHATGRVSADAAGTVIASAAGFDCLDMAKGARCDTVVPRPPGPRGHTLPGTPTSFDTPSVRLADGTVLKAVHPYPPQPTDTRQWRREQGGLERWRAAQPSAAPLVMAGDFNSGPVHPAFRRIAHGMTGSPRGPLTPTWPTEGRLPAFVQIDHVLSRGFDVTADGTAEIPGTDHLAVWAELRRLPQLRQ